MCVYLRIKCQVSSIILTSFRQGKVGNFTHPPPPTAKETPKNPPQLGLNNGVLPED